MSMSRSILIVEDDIALRDVLVEQLARKPEFHPIAAASLTEAHRFLESHEARVHAIIMDITLPDGDGCAFCADLRRNGCRLPVIMLTGASSDADVVRGLDAGANDYVIKPFRANELIARLQTQLRLFDNSVDAIFTIGSFTFHPSAKLLLRPETNQRIRLTGKEVAILKFLYKNSNRLVTRQTLLDKVWGYNSDVTTHTLETHIYRLRQKIEADPADCHVLMTVPGGYRMVRDDTGNYLPDRSQDATQAYRQL